MNDTFKLPVNRYLHHTYLTTLESKCSAINVVHLSFRTKATNISAVQQVPPKIIVLATKILIPIRNQKPRDQRTSHGKSRPDQESTLQSFTLGRERFLNGDENLRADGGSRLPYCSRKADEMPSKWCGKRLGAAEEGGDLRKRGQSMRNTCNLAHVGNGLTHAGTHLAQPIEDAVQDDEEGQDLHDWEDSAADDEAEK